MREIENILDIESEDLIGKQQIEKAKNLLATVETNYNSAFGDSGEFNEDFSDVREALKDIIFDMKSNVDKLSVIAFDSEKAAHFSALAQMMTVLLHANKQLLDVHKEKKKFYENKAKPEEAGTHINVNNAIFTGTTNDLKKWIDEQRKP